MQGWVVLCPPANTNQDIDQGRIRISVKYMPSVTDVEGPAFVKVGRAARSFHAEERHGFDSLLPRCLMPRCFMYRCLIPLCLMYRGDALLLSTLYFLSSVLSAPLPSRRSPSQNFLLSTLPPGHWFPSLSLQYQISNR